MRIELLMQLLSRRLGCRESIGLDVKGLLALRTSTGYGNSVGIPIDNQFAFCHIESLRAREREGTLPRSYAAFEPHLCNLPHSLRCFRSSSNSDSVALPTTSKPQRVQRDSTRLL